MTVGELIRQARKTAGIRPERLAADLQMSVRTWERVERNLRELKLSETHVVAELLEIPAEDLLAAATLTPANRPGSSVGRTPVSPRLLRAVA